MDSEVKLMARYTTTEVEQAISGLNNHSFAPWLLREEGLFKRFVFHDFNEAFAFMTRCAMYAEKMDHHPEWSNVYEIVEVRLITHEVAGLTLKDFAMAAKMNAYASL
jgi:4a-hydroxytetrahydrobiopterin dehydratase